MKISASPEHVEYAHNPLAEVICQVRFPATISFAEGIPQTLAGFLLQEGLTVETEEQTFSIMLAIGQPPQDGPPAGHQIPTSRTFHRSSSDNVWKVSIASDFVALTCTKYRNWPDFYPRFLALFEAAKIAAPSIFPVRVGLRYKDVIVREHLGLEGVEWHELIAPFILGPMGFHSLSDEGHPDDESSFDNFVSQSNIKLDDCSLLLQSGLLKSSQDASRAFLVDSDFYLDAINGPAFSTRDELLKVLNILHDNAGSLFRRSITEKLHAALGPTPV